MSSYEAANERNEHRLEGATRSQTIPQWTAEFLARIEALEAQVQELEGHVHDNRGCCVILPAEQKAGGWPEPKDNGDNAPLVIPEEPQINAKCACGLNAAGQHDEVCPSHE